MSSGDLFGHASPPAKLERPNDLTWVALDAVEARCTERAWLLKRAGDRQPVFVARSKAHRGLGPMINRWRMPRWLAAQNGWL